MRLRPDNSPAGVVLVAERYARTEHCSDVCVGFRVLPMQLCRAGPVCPTRRGLATDAKLSMA